MSVLFINLQCCEKTEKRVIRGALNCVYNFFTFDYLVND